MKRLLTLLIPLSFILSPSVFAVNATNKVIKVISSEPSNALRKKEKEKTEKEILAKREGAEIKIEKKERVEKETLSEKRFLVKSIRLEGNQVIPSEVLQPLVAPYEKKEWTLGDLEALTEAITAEYHKRGFLTSFAYLPAQDIENGDLLIEIIEGKIGKIDIRGNRYFRKKRMLSYARLVPDETLQIDKISTMIKQLNENPDREVTASLHAGELPKTTDIDLDVTDHFPLHAGFTYDNQGVDTLGKQRFGFTVVDNNVTGMDDVLSTGTIFGRNSALLFSQYQIPIIPWLGTKLNLGFSHGRVTSKRNLDPTSHAVNNSAQTYWLGIEQSVMNTERFSLDMQGRFEMVDNHTLEDAATLDVERLRMIKFGPTAAIADSWGGLTILSNQLVFGLGALGAHIFADPSAARQGVKPYFFDFQGNAARSQNLPHDCKIITKLGFQHSTRKLPSEEAFYLGGATTVRGYPEGDYLADSGVVGSLDLLAPNFLIPGGWQLPYAKTPLRKQIELEGFVDEAFGRLRGPSNIEANQRHMLGVGGGFRIHFAKNLLAKLEWAHGLGGQPLTESSRNQFYFLVEVEK